LSLAAGGQRSFLNDEIVYQGTSYANATAQATVHDFVPNSHLMIYTVQGTFNATGNVIGVTSNAVWTINTTSNMTTTNTAFEDIFDNQRIEAGSDSIIDWTETNPFGGD
jgi:hypothetical protein